MREDEKERIKELEKQVEDLQKQVMDEKKKTTAAMHIAKWKEEKIGQMEKEKEERDSRHEVIQKRLRNDKRIRNEVMGGITSLQIKYERAYREEALSRQRWQECCHKQMVYAAQGDMKLDRFIANSNRKEDAERIRQMNRLPNPWVEIEHYEKPGAALETILNKLSEDKKKNEKEKRIDRNNVEQVYGVNETFEGNAQAQAANYRDKENRVQDGDMALEKRLRGLLGEKYKEGYVQVAQRTNLKYDEMWAAASGGDRREEEEMEEDHARKKGDHGGREDRNQGRHGRRDDEGAGHSEGARA